MSAAGHVFDMINRNKQNRALKNARKDRYSKLKKIYSKELNRNTDANCKEKEISKEELVIIKAKIRGKIEQENKRSTVLTIIFTIITSISIVLFILSRINT